MSKSLRILYVVPNYPNSARTAAEVRSSQLANLLDERVELLVASFSSSGEFDPGSNTSVVSLPKKRTSALSYLRNLFNKLPRIFTPYRTKESIEVLRKTIAEFKPDLVHLDTMALTGLAIDLETQSVLLHTHDACSRKFASWIEASDSLVRKADFAFQHKKIQRFENRVFPKAAACVVDSEEDRTYLEEQTGAVVRLLPLGFDPLEFDSKGSKIDLGESSVVFSGSMSSTQSVVAAKMLVTQIMPKVWLSHPTTQLYLVGSDPSPELLKLAEQTDRVHVTGFVPSLSEYLRSCDVYVCPLTVGGGMRTRLVEALACGCAIVASENATTGLKENSTDEKPWLLGESANDYSRAISDLLSNSELRTSFKERSHAYAHGNYAWSAVADDLVTNYQSLLDQSRATSTRCS